MGQVIHGDSTTGSRLTIVKYFGGTARGRCFDFIVRDKDGTTTGTFTETELIELAKQRSIG